MVLVFDLANEKFRDHIPPPPMLTETDDDSDDDGDDFIVLGVSCGILYYAVCQTFEGRNFHDVWLLMKKSNDPVMKGREEHQLWGWSKAASLEQREPFAFMEDGSIVLRYDEGTIKVFLPSTSTWGNLVNFSAISRQVFRHKHTLVSLKELGEEKAEILKPQGIVEIEETDSSEYGSD